jgi:hypothetical protein
MDKKIKDKQFKDSVKVIGRAKQKKKEEKPCATHTQTCKAIMEYMHKKHPDLARNLIHIANEGKRSPQQGKKLKDEGLQAGVYDYFFARVKKTLRDDGSYDFIPGLWIEVKKEGDILSAAQTQFGVRMLSSHYSVCTVYSIDEFIKEIEEYLK